LQQTIKADTGWRIWWQLTRPHTLTAAFAPVFLGTMIALTYGKIQFPLFFAMLTASIFIQMATNMFNEYYDFKRGLDTAESVGIGGGIVRHGLKPKNVLTVAILLYILAALIGIYICMNSSWWLVVIGLIGMAAGYFYTGGPLPIAYTPFGELVSGLLMGTFFVLIAFFIQTNTITVESVLISVPIGILVGSINLSNNIRDIEEDIKGGRKTLAILLGRDRAVILLALSFVVSYLWVIGIVVLGYVTPWALVMLLGINQPIAAVRGFQKGATEPQYMRVAMKSTAMTNTNFGMLLSAGLLISYLF